MPTNLNFKQKFIAVKTILALTILLDWKKGKD
jgi:hypothetical protein